MLVALWVQVVRVRLGSYFGDYVFLNLSAILLQQPLVCGKPLRKVMGLRGAAACRSVAEKGVWSCWARRSARACHDKRKLAFGAAA